MSDTNIIKSIFFSEFHPVAGPRIVYQVPDEFITKEIFDSIHVYIITKPYLSNKTITVNLFNHKIVGCPVIIDNPSYARNALIFNLCFVFDSASPTTSYENIVRKLAYYMRNIELQSGFLSNEETKATLPQILTQIHSELNDTGSCSVPISSSMVLHLKVVSENKDPPTVQDHDTPILVPQRGVTSLLLPSSPRRRKWDLATEKFLTYVDGFRHVAKIAAEADVDISIVKACVQNMVYCGAVKLISIFQYCNVYTTTSNINRLVEDEHLQAECIQYVALPDKTTTFRSILQMYCGLSACTTVRDLCSRFAPHVQGIDERKLIQYGLMRNLIRRLHEFPISLVKSDSSISLGGGRLRQQPYFNGTHNLDEICCRTGLSHQEMTERIESDPNIVVCWK